MSIQLVVCLLNERMYGCYHCIFCTITAAIHYDINFLSFFLKMPLLFNYVLNS